MKETILQKSAYFTNKNSTSKIIIELKNRVATKSQKIIGGIIMEKINLKKGFIEKYDFGEIKLHSYQPMI